MSNPGHLRRVQKRRKGDRAAKKIGDGGAALLVPSPLGTALLGFAGRNPSGIPSATVVPTAVSQSGPAFLPGKTSGGLPVPPVMSTGSAALPQCKGRLSNANLHFLRKRTRIW